MVLDVDWMTYLNHVLSSVWFAHLTAKPHMYPSVVARNFQGFPLQHILLIFAFGINKKMLLTKVETWNCQIRRWDICAWQNHSYQWWRTVDTWGGMTTLTLMPKQLTGKTRFILWLECFFKINEQTCPVVCSTDRSKAVVPVLVLLFVALWFILRGDFLYVFLCVILFLCFSVLLVLRLPGLGKRELILVLFVRLFGLCLFRFVGFLFLLGSGKGSGLWLWHSLDFSLTFFSYSVHIPVSEINWNRMCHCLLKHRNSVQSQIEKEMQIRLFTFSRVSAAA